MLLDLTLYSSTAGLSYDTQFGLRNILELAFNDAYFSVPAHFFLMPDRQNNDKL